LSLSCVPNVASFSRQSRETGNIGYTRQRQIKQIKQKHNMIVLDTTIQKKSYTYFI
jgi:hypothetical protein